MNHLFSSKYPVGHLIQPLPCNYIRRARLMGAGIFGAPGIDQDSHMAATIRDLEMITHFAISLFPLDCI